MTGHFVSAFAQDKWRLGERLTLTLGVRYDVEWIPLDESGNPAFPDSGRYPVDTDNLAPRLGFAYRIDPSGRSVLRGGYGVFFDKTPFELLSPILTNGRFSDSFIASFPADSMDPGPSQGRLPAEPLLRNGLVVDAALVRARFPPGVLAPNLGTVFMDSPHRRVARTHQATIGYARQVAPDTSAGADYVHSGARDLLGLRDLNPGVRADTSRTGPVIRVNPAFATSVLQYGNFGRVDYDSLQVYLERRFRRGLSARVSYALGYSRGNTSGNGSPQVLVQQLDDLRLDMNEGPTDFDRRHNFVVSTTASVPRTGGLTVSAVARALSGVPFTIVDSTTDADRNGILFDVLPAGTYAGAGRNAISVESDGRRNGAYGPGAFQLDLRLGYRIAPGGERRLDVFGEIFNLTNASSFDNPVTAVQGHLAADRRLADFLELRALRPGAIPRTGQIGIRLGF
jgi:hypothetical protein